MYDEDDDICESCDKIDELEAEVRLLRETKAQLLAAIVRLQEGKSS